MTKLIYLGTKRQISQPQLQERRTMHPKSTRFRLHELILCLRRRLKTPVRIEEDRRSDIPGGPVTLRLGNSLNSPLVLVRTLPADPRIDGESAVAAHNGLESFLVYSAAFEHCQDLRALNRYTVDELVEQLRASSPKVVEEVIGQEESTRAA